jgi:subtilisin-like proprotein convertase family protein
MTFTTRSHFLLACAVVCGIAAPAAATEHKERMTSQMLDIAREIDTLKSNGGNPAIIEELEAQYRQLSDLMGGDDPARMNTTHQMTWQSRSDIATVFGTPPAGAIATTTQVCDNVPHAINDVSTTTATVNVAVADTYLWDVDLIVNITHTFASDLDITLTSPNGTIVTLTTDNGGGNDNVFNGTRWDDDATALTTDVIYANNIPQANLVPEGALGAVIGENPNGVWTIRVTDDLGGDIGSLASWCLDVTTLNTTPTTFRNDFFNNTPTPIPDVTTTDSTLVVAGVTPSLCDLNVTVDIDHTFASDLDIFLISPGGTTVTLSTDNGGGNDNVFAGTTWNDNGAALTTDVIYVNNVPQPSLIPEGALAALQGEDPNGVWTLRIVDDLGGDVGTLQSWSLNVTTCSVEECHLLIGFGGGAAGVNINGFGYVSQLGSVRSHYMVTMQNGPSFPLPHAHSHGGGPGFHHLAISGQVVMYNPTMFPNNPSQWSQRVQVNVQQDGSILNSFYGTLNGIHATAERFTDQNGIERLRFPFWIEGM